MTLLFRLEAWWNPHAVLSSVIALNLMHTTLLRHLSGEATATITMNLRLYKEEQLMTGVPPALFWASNLTFDLVIYGLTWALVGLIVNFHHDLAATTNGAAPMFVHLVVTALDVTRGVEHSRWLPRALSPFPPFAFPWALVKLLQLDAENAQCERYARTKQGAFFQLDVFCLALSANNRFPGPIHFCCERTLWAS
ncbi:hypothetical protein HPB48_014478 [Haemaphysalis longicornis]|uniref:Uncharacterized protein n=1 Tax=Haemaphysalis longicornis TaxID=44386 RepID=A0A9J6G9Q6_HAELO|nr:hypothetical protein HPB48_014478 [Haemaphysalis longicornis]